MLLKFDNSGNIGLNSGSSVGATVAQANGIGYSSTGKYNGGLSVNAGTLRIDLNDNLGIPDTITIAAWLKFDQHNPSGRSYLFDFRHSSVDRSVQGEAGCWIVDDANPDRMTIWRGAGYPEDSFDWPVNLGVWEHYALVSGDGDTTKVYRNGNVEQEMSGKMKTASTVIFGAFANYHPSGGHSNYWMYGTADNIFIQRGVAKTAAEIVGLMGSL